MDMKLSQKQELLAKRKFVFRYVKTFSKTCIVQDEATVQSGVKFHQQWMFFFWMTECLYVRWAGKIGRNSDMGTRTWTLIVVTPFF